MSLEKDIKILDNKRLGAAIKDTECEHEYWTKRCSICSTILETESNLLVDGPVRKGRTEFENLVTSFKVSQELKHAGITLKCSLYWIHYLTSDYLTLRVKENLTLNNTEIFPAYTAQELCSKLKSVDVDSDILIENCDKPDELALALIAIYNIEDM